MIEKTLWNLACDYDGMPRDTRYAAFSLENPYARKLNLINLGVQSVDAIGFTLK